METLDHIKAILFDLDNTLIQRQKSAYAFFCDIVERCYPGLEEAEKLKRADELYLWDGHGYTPKNELFYNLLNKYGFVCQPKDLADLWVSDLWKYTKCFPQSKHVLSTLRKKYKIGCLTNGNPHSQRRKLEVSGLQDAFDAIRVSGEYGKGKPDPEIYLVLAKDLGVKASECLFVGDYIQTDIVGAYNAGMTAVWIEPEILSKTDYPVQRIFVIEDLLDFL